MAYRFKSSDRTITDGVRRIAAREFELISAMLADTHLSAARKVHEGRKATKRLRALLRLVGPSMPEARAEIDALRDAARRLSALRDRGALAETFTSLDLPDDLEGRLSPLIAPARVAAPRGSTKLLKAFGEEMLEAESRALGWDVSRKGWSALEPGLRKSYRRLRRAADAAAHADDEDPVHDLRKRAKDHWYHTLLLRDVFPDVMDGYGAAGERLCDDLGTWRDLGLLGDAIGALPADSLPKPELKVVRDIIGKARRRALKRASRTVRLLTAESPSEYASRIGNWWRSARF